MMGEWRHAGFTELSPITPDRTRLPPRAGRLRLVFTLCGIFGAGQFLVPVIARVAFNGGRVWPTDEGRFLWGVIEGHVLGVPAWLTIATGDVGMVAAVAYLLGSRRDAGADTPYVSLVSLLIFGCFPWAIGALDTDPTGIVRTPGPEGYRIGWHWALSPVAAVVLAVGIVVSVQSRGNARGAGAQR